MHEEELNISQTLYFRIRLTTEADSFFARAVKLALTGERLKAYDEKKDPLYKKLIYVQKYFSKKYRKMYLDKAGKAKFEYWKTETEKFYPELKNESNP